MRLFIFTLLITIYAQVASADDMRPASLTIQQLNNSTFEAVFKVPARDGARLKLDVQLDENSRQLGLVSGQFIRQAYITSWKFERPGLSGLEITILGLRDNSADVLLRIIDAQGRVITDVLNADLQSYKLSDEQKTQNTFVTYMVLGIEHILIGLDHLLFVACLIYISRTGKKLLLTITGFTIAHSITLILASTGTVYVPIAPVEAVIALSIVLLAWEILKNKQNSITLKYPVAVSSSFGLLHGFGFASVLSDIGLPEDEAWQALLSFNVGVEIGQLLFVGALFAGFLLLRLMMKTLTLDKLRFVVGYFCGSLAMFWVIQRLAAF
ncbi:HupE/UreJ family protein [Thalassotalea sp. PS06]|uniref:HupE/UreJ family protein n=1 Tax=Thalassotalea sp. PS06 TaxID=2594005 RepID=UPI00116503D1|nr:HupE/UreJ family protein [Thalassotalea sp. PS06]QDP01923.1 HupE/UreJ family protein [Thalassotalea sp. PS06]